MKQGLLQNRNNAFALTGKSLKVSLFAFLIAGSAIWNEATATKYFLTTAGQNTASTSTNWNTGGIGGGGSASGGFTNAADTFVVSSTINGIFVGGTGTTIAGTLQVDGTLTIGAGNVNQITTLTVNGTMICSNSGATQITVPTGGNGNTTTASTKTTTEAPQETFSSKSENDDLPF